MAKKIRVKLMMHCPACGNKHENFVLSPFTRPDGYYTHWALCPTNREPILKHIDEYDTKPEENGHVVNEPELFPEEGA